jgi:hypothetical protein
MNKFYEHLNHVFINIESEFPLFTTNYEVNGLKGQVHYEMTKMIGVNKPIRQEFFILLSSDMTDIISYFNDMSPLTEEDYNDVRAAIMDHSKKMVENYHYDNQTI